MSSDANRGKISMKSNSDFIEKVTNTLLNYPVRPINNISSIPNRIGCVILNKGQRLKYWERRSMFICLCVLWHQFSSVLTVVYLYAIFLKEHCGKSFLNRSVYCYAMVNLYMVNLKRYTVRVYIFYSTFC